MKRDGFISALGFSAALLCLPLNSALAFEYPLSDTSIRNAYFLAVGEAKKRDAFFETYTHRFPAPSSGPQVAFVEIETPLACVAEKMALHPMNYRAPDAVREFFGKPAEFRVRVRILFTDTYPPPKTALGHFWTDFKIRLVQNGKEVRARSAGAAPIYDDNALLGYTGANLRGEYDPSKIQSGPAVVEIDTPGGQKVQSIFVLASLR